MATLLKATGIIIMICGVVSAFILGSNSIVGVAALSIAIAGIISGMLFLALGEIITQLKRIADKQPIVVESKTVYADTPKHEKQEAALPVEDDAEYTGRRCKKCNKPLPDSNAGTVCNSCMYGAPSRAR